MPSRPTTRGRVRWWTYGKSTPLLEELMLDPERVLEGPGSVARSRVGRKRFYRVEAAREPALFVKEFRVPAGLPRLRYWLRPSKAQRERALAERIAARGVEIAEPIAVGEERRLGALLRSFSVIRARAGRDLRSILRDPTTRPDQRRALLRELGRWARQLHDAGVDQDDFSPNNFLWLESGAFCLIDFERCRVGAPVGRRGLARLAKLHRHDLGVSRADRLRVLRSYLGDADSTAARRDAWREIRRAFFRIRARDARRAAAAAFREGRHVARDGQVWTVVGRERLPVQRLEVGRESARRVWVTAHQLERLGLPALRPVRLGPGWVELEAAADACGVGEAARRPFEGYGRFTRDPTWAADGRLADLEAFAVAPRG